MMIDGIPNRPLYFYQKDIIYYLFICMADWSKVEMFIEDVDFADQPMNELRRILEGCPNHTSHWSLWICQWIGLRENLQEIIDFPIKYGAFL